jgi:predicted amidohydrolase
MNTVISSAQYPITEHKTFLDWQKHVESWVAKAARDRAELALFPEYGAMELVSIFPQEIREDIRQQVIELNLLRDDFCAVFSGLSKKYNIIIVAPSIPVIDADKNVNRVFVFSPKGSMGYQDKLFMTRFENEDWGIRSGEKTLTLFEASWGNFGIQICYDVEFSLGSQLLSSAGATLILAPSCTETIRGATRVHIGARARALENQAYTVVSQTIGEAPWSPAVDINYGFAAIYSTPDLNLPEEGIIAAMTPQKPGWLVEKLDFSKIDAVRTSGQVFNFKDHQGIRTGFTEEAVSIKRVLL